MTAVFTNRAPGATSSAVRAGHMCGHAFSESKLWPTLPLEVRMVLSCIRRLFTKKKSWPILRPVRKPFAGRFLPNVENLDERIVPATTAVFTKATGLLTVLGDAGNNTIAISRDAAG